MATKKPSAAQLAARKLFAMRAKSGAFKKKATPKKNPLTRVKRNSPSMSSGKAPSARLKKRRAATAKAPAGYYANPKPKTHRFELRVANKPMAWASTPKVAKELAQWLADLYRAPVQLIDHHAS